MGAGNVQAVFDRFANTTLSWRTFAALVFMAKTSVDEHDWPYYSAGLDLLARTLFRTPEPTSAQQRDVRRLVRGLVEDQVVTKDREASSLRKRAADRPARYRLNIHERADLARKAWEANQAAPSTGVIHPSPTDASTGVNHPCAEPSSTGVNHPSSTGVNHPPEGSKHRGESPLEGVLEPEEEVEEDARASDVEPQVPRPPADEAQAPPPRCTDHEINPTERPCGACGAARNRRKAWDSDRQAADSAWRGGVRAWMAWADRQPMCDCGERGGNLVRPDTGVLRCPRCRRKEAA